MIKKFNPKEQNFIDQMVSYYGKKTATQCAIDSGFGVAGARSRATELMKRADIRNEIDRQLEEIRDKWRITKDQHFQELGELRDMAKESKNVNAAVRAEELRGKVAGFYIDKQIIASAALISLPDGTKKSPEELTEEDIEKHLKAILNQHKRITSHANKNNSKRNR